MKKMIKAILTAAIVCVTAMAMSVCVFADGEDVELPVTKAKQTNGAWGQSVTYDRASFDCGRITEDSIVEVEFELNVEWTRSDAPIELIFQNYSTAKPEIWAKISPFEYDETSAKFQYDDMVLSYGSDDFSTVDNMCIGDCGVKMLVTKVTVTNCEAPPETTTETTTTTVTETTTAATTTTAAPAETEAPAETTAAASESESGGIPIVLIIVITVVVAVIAVVVIIVLKNRKRFY